MKKVRMKGNGMVRRCAKYSGRKRRASGYRKRSTSKRRASGYRRGHRPFNKGKTCKTWQTNKRGIRSCKSYGGKPRRARDTRSPSQVYANAYNMPVSSGPYGGPYDVEQGSWYNRLRQRMAG
jgi:hypothetical protein